MGKTKKSFENFWETGFFHILQLLLKYSGKYFIFSECKIYSLFWQNQTPSTVTPLFLPTFSELKFTNFSVYEIFSIQIAKIKESTTRTGRSFFFTGNKKKHELTVEINGKKSLLYLYLLSYLSHPAKNTIYSNVFGIFYHPISYYQTKKHSIIFFGFVFYFYQFVNCSHFGNFLRKFC